MTHGAQILRQILTQAQQGGSKKLYVFDLDSTLFDVSPRIQKIIHDFTLIPEHIAEFPEEVEILKTIELEKTDWGIKNAFFRAGLDKQHPSFYEKVRGFWFQRFFSNDYLQYDVPYEGALNYVEALRKTGNDIVYLTGRDEIRMGKGSRETLLSV
ncbi:MAG: HAD family hydrolase, partial [Pseudobdellovibrionaceae bacterium]